MENAQYDYIEVLILHRICYYHKCCNIATDVTMSLKAITFKKDKLDMLKVNIQIRVIAFAWEESKTK